jgi:S1-C subfamily serine protease
LACLLLCAGIGAPVRPAHADGALSAVETEFRKVIERLAPATVVCVPSDTPQRTAGFSSGVLVSAEGHVLSDGDAGLVWSNVGGEVTKTWRDAVDIRVPQITTGGFITYRATVLKRVRDADTTLLKIDRPPSGGLPFVRPGSSAMIEPGDFAFAVGSSSSSSGGTGRVGVLPTLTSGIVAAVDPAPAGDARGAHLALYVSAAVNEGINGGPLVDLEGQLIGTLSMALDVAPNEPHQYLGKAIPIDRIRIALADAPGAAAVFGDGSATRSLSGTGRAMERVLRRAAAVGRTSLVSLAITRRRPISTKAPVETRTVEIPRYTGPVSGIMATGEGHVVTSIYNLTNVYERVSPLWPKPEGAGLAEGLGDIESITVYRQDGAPYAGKLAGVDLRLGLALIAPVLVEGQAVPTGTAVPTAAPADGLRRGAFVLALGEPYGPERRAAPLMTLGILSKFHPDTTAAPWRGHWQTDAAGLDSNAGGLAVDLQGQALGMLSLWDTARHGRSSGVAFLVPWKRVQQSVLQLLAGEEPKAGRLGVYFGGSVRPVLDRVVPGGPAEAAGLTGGDLILSIDGHGTSSVLDAIAYVRSRFAGEMVTVRYRHGTEELETTVLLDERPAE